MRSTYVYLYTEYSDHRSQICRVAHREIHPRSSWNRTCSASLSPDKLNIESPGTRKTDRVKNLRLVEFVDFSWCSRKAWVSRAIVWQSVRGRSRDREDTRSPSGLPGEPSESSWTRRGRGAHWGSGNTAPHARLATGIRILSPSRFHPLRLLLLLSFPPFAESPPPSVFSPYLNSLSVSRTRSFSSFSYFLDIVRVKYWRVVDLEM